MCTVLNDTDKQLNIMRNYKMSKITVTEEQVQEAGSEIWVKRGGERVATKDMSDEYVRKAFNALLKKIRVRNEPTIQDMGDIFAEVEAEKEAELAAEAE
jgi:uncharacterized protein YehS (DUF1456 family)